MIYRKQASKQGNASRIARQKANWMHNRATGMEVYIPTSLYYLIIKHLYNI